MKRPIARLTDLQPGPLLKRRLSSDARFVGGLGATTCADCAYRRRA